MKFKIFTLLELIYTKVAYTLVFIITISCVVLYFYKRDSEEIAFIISLFYALFLFIISVYINTVSTRVQNTFHRRKEQYRSLKDLAEIYKPTFSAADDLLSHIMLAQGMTGRIGNGKRPFIRINGFEYTEKYLKLEESYLALRSDLHALLNDEINKYIYSHKPKKKVRNVFVHDINKFIDGVDDWVDKHFDLTVEERTNFCNHVEYQLKVNKKKFNKWYSSTNKIKKMIKKTSEKCHENMLRIERVYGEMLFETLNEENTLYTNFNVLEKLIQEVKDEVLTHLHFLEITDEYYEKVHHYLKVMDRKLESIKEEVEEISNNTYRYPGN